MSALAHARREWRQRTTQSIARQQGRCSMCGKKDKTGLMEGKCTPCYFVVEARIEARGREVQPPPVQPSES